MRTSLINSEGASNNLDSFLDIITNVIGVLILIAATIAIQVTTVSIPHGSPLVSEVPDDLEEVSFHCGGNRIEIADYYERIWNGQIVPALNQRYPDGWNYNQAAQWANGKTFGNPQIESRMVWDDSGYYLHTTVLPGPQIGSLAEIQGPNSSYLAALNKLDPQKHYVYFFLSADSIEVFRAARRMAIEKGFRVGVLPLTDGIVSNTMYSTNRWNSKRLLND